MLKSLRIDYYPDGYRLKHINCMDFAIAGASGYYNYDNYFYYCFYYCLLNNWTGKKEYNWISFKNEILTKLGLRLNFIEVNDTNELIASIKGNIDNQCPIVMLVKCCATFFSNLYLTNNVASHSIIISDYDAERKIVIIREGLLNWEVTQNVMRGDPFLKLQLTEDLISDIWLKSNNLFKEENSGIYNKLFSIEKISEPQIISYNGLIEDFINNYNINDSNLIQLVDGFNDNIVGMKNNIYIESIRRNFQGSINILFDVFEKSFDFLKYDNYKKKRFYEFRDKYKNFRHLIISKLHINVLRDKYLDKVKISKITDEIRNMDTELFALVNEFYLYNKQQQKRATF